MASRILVIDDSPTILLLLRGILGADGHEVFPLELFARLPVVLRDDTPDLIILDLEMPALGGERVGDFIRRFQPQEIPILIHSSRPPEIMQEVVVALRADGYIEKGSAASMIRERVRSSLAHSSVYMNRRRNSSASF